MKKLIIISIIAFLALESSNAQFFVEFNNGYAKGINNKNYFKKENSYTSKDYYILDLSDYSQYNLAEGISFEPKFGYKINNWLSVSAGIYYLLGNSKIVTYYNESDDLITLDFTTDTRAELTHTYCNEIFSLKNLYGLTPEISIDKQIKSFNLRLNLSVLISKTTLNYNSDTIETRYSTMGNEYGYISMRTTTTNRYKYYLNNNINFSARIGIEASYSLKNNLFIFGKVYYNNLQFKPSKQKQYYHYNNRKFESYRSDVQDKPETISDKVEIDEIVTEKDINGDLFGMNTLQFSLGIRYIFNNEKNK